MIVRRSPSTEGRVGAPTQRSPRDLGIDLDRAARAASPGTLAERRSSGDWADEPDDRLDDVSDGGEMPDADVDRRALDVGSTAAAR